MTEEILLAVRELMKQYPGVLAVNGVSLEFRKGEVHAIVGENGAGKSTLIKILTGAILPDAGKIVYGGTVHSGFDAQTALELGIAAIYQEFNLIPHLTVAENIFFGREPKKNLWIDFAEMNRRSVELCREMGLAMHPGMRIKDLGVAYKQIVEIVKAISRNIKVLIMDEPTAPLTNRETEALFKIVRVLKKRGVTILYISHRLEEVFALCDRVTVMRDGGHVATMDTAETNKAKLISLMVGRELSDNYPRRTRPVAPEKALEVAGLCSDRIHDISFTLYNGEILGFGGLVGAGRTEMARALFGVDAVTDGEIRVKGVRRAIRHPKDAVKAGIVLIPEDRKTQGLVLGMRVRENITYSSLPMICTWSFVSRRDEERVCGRFRDDLNIKTPTLDQYVKNLSGGNQQKVVLAKWLAADCDILIFDEPTRGIDVGAKQEIHHLMRRLADEGKSIIMISSEMPELLGMSDRICVMFDGRIVRELAKGNFSQETLLEMASGQSKEAAR